MKNEYEDNDHFLKEISGASAKGLGRTMVLDRLAPGTLEAVRLLPEFVHTVKIGWGLPMLLNRKKLEHRVRELRSAGVDVSNGGTTMELAASKGKHGLVLEQLMHSNFNSIELSEGVVELHRSVKRDIAEFAHSNGMKLSVEVGRKNPRNQLSLEGTVEKINEALELEPDTVIIEGRETGRSVEIFDDAGEIKWDWVERICEACPQDKLMFEAPQEKQQTELILHLGKTVNLGNVSVQSIGALATQRLGLRGDTLGVRTGSAHISGSPASRFIYHLLTEYGFMDQGRLMHMTGLTRRAVQSSLRYLISEGWVTEKLDPSDLRKRVYMAETVR
jgi:phosphosulfolactate synthase